MCKVFVIDHQKRPLNPIHPAQARQLLNGGKTAVYKRFPFTIILKKSSTNIDISPLRLKLDPGAKYTGIAIVNDANGEVVFAAELKHRGFAIRDALTSRRQLRRSRRSRKTRYRQPRFLNRTRPKGWLAPSLQSRIENIKTWVSRLRKIAPIQFISQELVKFDMQLIRHPDIQGKEYQQGELAGYETRQYLLEKWHRECAYCGIKDVPLQIEHIQPRAKGGSNSITNLTLSCAKCNTKKATKDIRDFLKKDPVRLNKILNHAKKPLADAAAVNTTRFALLETLKATGLPLETGSGGLTKFNRTQRGLNKSHWLDAACVGGSTPILKIKGVRPLLITANGHGTRQSCRTNKYGFPIRHCSRTKFHFGFQTGDIVKAVVIQGKKVGTYVGRIATRATGSFNVSTTQGLIQGISYKYCKTIHKKDGYAYGT
ncbi:RNA-guided endonuclease IscB [Anabaena sp. UHCC 0399]|uniref:RNA-guided endonuclease IscB n=1 Tax=Anabaena sp. UHCC 0399 TaxID=3110238 RepID=UPI002B20ED4F|nr:RNA-guided endonuclease IscB [Anabaena sp. UHCC 0399]MEA5566639.1 RNA-guided endonuclease IscB [Anabaena sp. UHCC 0399]